MSLFNSKATEEESLNDIKKSFENDFSEKETKEETDGISLKLTSGTNVVDKETTRRVQNNTLKQIKEANGGKIVLVGVSMEPITIPSVIAVMGEIRMLGSIAYSEFDFDKIISLIKDKQLDVIKYIDKRITLDEVQDAFIELTSGNSDTIKIVIKPN